MKIGYIILIVVIILAVLIYFDYNSWNILFKKETETKLPFISPEDSKADYAVN